MYSAHRIQQARRYADSTGMGKLSQGARRHPPELCVGVPSVEREGIPYLKATMGSLQHGLGEKERARLRFARLAGSHEPAGPCGPWPAVTFPRWPTTSLSIMTTRKDWPWPNSWKATKATQSSPNSTYSIVMEECRQVWRSLHAACRRRCDILGWTATPDHEGHKNRHD